MNTLTAYHLFLTPLSPIHIGTGASYEPTNYVIEGDTLHEFDTGGVAEGLAARDREELRSIVDRRPDEAMLRLVQKFFHDRRRVLAPLALHRIPVQSGVAALYRERVGQIAQQEARGRRVINQLEIACTAYNPVTRLPILPGSSVKGAIRTALLDQLNAGRSAPERQGLHPFQGKETLFRYCVDGKLFLERDPMRLVHISDAAWQGEPGLPATEVAFAVNKKKAPTGEQPDRQRRTRADSGSPQILECIPAWRYRAFTGQLNVHSLGDVRRSDKVPADDLRFDMERITEACNKFYIPILKAEITLLRNRGWLDGEWAEAVTNLVDSETMKRGQVWLLRVGRHCGAESVTLNGARKILIRGGERSDRIEEQTTTIWLAARERDQESGLLPFGWLLVECSPLEKAPMGEDYSALKEVCEQRLAPARQWADGLKAKEAEWRRKGLGPKVTASPRASKAPVRPHSPWVNQKLEELCCKPGIKPDDALRGKALAEAVRAIEDQTLRDQALADIVARWQERGWWDARLSGSAKQAKAIYEELRTSSHAKSGGAAGENRESTT
jgi:CRISPR-associated protein Csm5